MEIRVAIVLFVSLSSLVPPAFGTGLITAATIAGAKGVMAVGVKGAALGLGLGLAAKGAIALLAKKTLLGILLKAAILKGAALKGALVAKKAAITGVTGLALKGFGNEMLANANDSSQVDSAESNNEITRDSLMAIVSTSARVMQSALKLGEAVAKKSRAVYRVMSAVPRLLDPTIE